MSLKPCTLPGLFLIPDRTFPPEPSQAFHPPEHRATPPATPPPPRLLLRHMLPALLSLLPPASHHPYCSSPPALPGPRPQPPRAAPRPVLSTQLRPLPCAPPLLGSCKGSPHCHLKGRGEPASAPKALLLAHSTPVLGLPPPSADHAPSCRRACAREWPPGCSHGPLPTRGLPPLLHRSCRHHHLPHWKCDAALPATSSENPAAS